MLVDLSKTPFPEVLLRLSANRSSGDLVVRHQRLVKTVFFDSGRVVFAASNLRKDRLGEALLALGRITGEELRRASELMRPSEHRRRFGDALVEAGAMDKDEIGTAVARQVRRIVVSLFALPAGAASFDERPCAIPVEYMVAMSLHQLLYAGIKSIPDERLVVAGLGDRTRQVRLARVPPFKFPFQRCPAAEREILEHARRRVSLEQLASVDGALSYHRLRSVYALFASGVLEPAEPGAGPEPIVQTTTGTFLLSGLRREKEPSQREALRQEVQQEVERSARLDVESWLAGAPPEEVVRALEQKMERYHAMLDAVGEDTLLRTSIELILGRAFTLLRRVRAARTAAPGLPPQARQTQARAGTPATAAPPPASASRQAPPETPAGDSPPVQAVAAPPPEAASAAAADDSRRLMEAERALMEGDVRMTISDHASAVESYGRLVEYMPNVAAYRLKLAIAMACWPRTKKQAERQFLEALRLKPNDAHLHYQFGLYYKAMKQRARALTEMRTVLSLDPRHAEGRKELEALSPKDTALTSLKKLFRQ